MRKYLLKGHNNYPTMVSETYSLLLNYGNNTTTYIGNTKDVDTHSFATDGEVEDKKNNTPHGRKKGGR